MVTINAQQLTNGWAVYVSCLSTDDKPNLFHPPGVFSAGLVPMPNGAKLRELDTGKTYRFDADSAAWVPQPAAQDEAVGLGLTGASVGDFVRVNAVDSNGKPTSWKHVPLNEIKCNRNLLDNWYFVGGGSQLGDGVFPINQRRQTTYSNDGYCIDRWKTEASSGFTAELNNGITIINTHASSRRGIQQFFTNENIIYGRELTGSILLADGHLYSGTITCPNSRPEETEYIPFVDFDGNTFRIVLKSDVALQVQIVVAVGSNLSILAVKVELGSEQTLAHNEGTAENPVWVLNEIPDYGEELAKCQRYLCNVDFTGACYSTTNGASAYTVVATPVKMAGQTHLVNASYKVSCRFESVTIQNCTLEMKATRGNGVGANIYPPSGETFPIGKLGAIISGETLLSCEP